MRDGRRVETRRDRKALARDAGMGRISVLSVLAGALCALAAFEVIAAIAGAVGVAVNGGTNFGAVSAGQFKTMAGVVVAVSLFLAFIFGGYVAGRMSRRRGATHGLLAGVAGVVLGAAVVATVRASGADNGLARAAAHIQVADTWHQWRTFGLVGAIVAAAAMVVGGLTGGVEGERWHGKLLTRAVDPSFGPEAERRAEARRRMREAEVARLAAADHVGRLTGANRAAGQTEAAPPTVETPAAVARPTRRTPFIAGEQVSRNTPAPPHTSRPAGPVPSRAPAATPAETRNGAGPRGRRWRPRHAAGRS